MNCPDCGCMLPPSVTAEYADEIAELQERIREAHRVLRDGDLAAPVGEKREAVIEEAMRILRGGK